MHKVLVLMGSKSDLPVAEKAVKVLKGFNIEVDVRVASAHRTPKRVEDIVKCTDAQVIIAIAGMAAALPGVIASFTCKPVIGVPVSGTMKMDALLSMAQMPPGIPVATVGMDRGDNAAYLALQMIAMFDEDVWAMLLKSRSEMADRVERDSKEVEGIVWN